MSRPASAAMGTDPITTEVTRNGLVTAAEQMKVVLCRAASHLESYWPSFPFRDAPPPLLQADLGGIVRPDRLVLRFP